MTNQGYIMRRLLGKPLAADSAHEHSISVTSSPIQQSYRPNKSQNARYYTGAPISCIDRSPDGRGILLAGPYVFKILSLEGQTIKETLDLRSIIMRQIANRSIGSHSVSDQISIRDAKW